jgi:hypothetical protein
MIRKLLKFKILFISAFFFFSAVSFALPLTLSFGTPISLLNVKTDTNADKHTTSANFYFSDELSFANYLWEDTPTAQAGFKKVFKKLEVTILKEEVGEGEKKGNLKVDTILAISCPGDISVNNDVGSCGAVVTYTNPTSDVSGNTVEKTDLTGFNSGDVFPIGDTILIFKELDSGGTPTGLTCSFTVTVTDTQNPTITTLAAISVNADMGVCTYASSQLTKPVGSDNCSVVSVIASPASLALGSDTVTWTVTDGSGNTATSTQTVTVADNQNPTITTLAAISVNADMGVCTYASSQLTKPVGSDNCSVVSVIASPASLTLGANTVTWTVTDGSGNTATSTQTVTVIDNQNPIAICKPVIVTLDNSGNASITTSDIDGGSTDNCGIASIAISRSLFNCGNVGNNDVTLTVTDNSGNKATCIGVVTVLDPAANATVSVSASTTAICEGESVTFTATPNNPGIDPHYQWYVGTTAVGIIQQLP